MLAFIVAHFIMSGPSEEIDFAKIKDPLIKEGMIAAVTKNLLPSADEKVYPGHFYINADGGGYGSDTTWPGLDSWQMAGAYLLLGKTRIVTDYFDFVEASQRKDGNIPFAIFSGGTQADDAFLRGLRNPEDRFTYKPPVREGIPVSSRETRSWVGLFRHWELDSNPLATLGPICYILTAREIYQATNNKSWLKTHIGSVQAAGKYLLTQISPNGLLSGSGFYTELPPRNGWDGVTQCYAVEAFHDLEKLQSNLGNNKESGEWKKQATSLATNFRRAFWVDDHFAEYIHATRGVIDDHGLTDTNWSAIAFDVASPSQKKVLWPRLMAEKGFWVGGVPTLTATKPFSYQKWEAESVPFSIPSNTNDVASMGRSWYVEALACKNMHETQRLITSAQLVSKVAEGGFWRERYHPQPDGTTLPAGSSKYCEYPAVLIRVVLENRSVFLKR